MTAKKQTKSKTTSAGGKKQKQETFISPVGVAAYAWTTKPDTKFDEEGKYKLTLLLDKSSADDKQKAFLKSLAQKDKKLVKDGDKIEYKGEGDNPFIGKWRVDFKSSFPPDLRDSKKNPLPEGVAVMSGDVVRVAFSMAPYDGFGGGWTLYLNAVQLIEKRNFGRKAGDAFDEVDGGYTGSAGPRDNEDDSADEGDDTPDF